MKCENVPKAVKKPPVLCTTPKTTFSRCRQMEDGGNYQFAHAQHEKFCQFNFRLPSCVDTVLNLKPQTNGTTGPPSVCDNRSTFPGKSIALQHVFYIAQSSEIQEVDAIQ